MNPLNSQPFGMQFSQQFNPQQRITQDQLMSNIRNVKSLMQMAKGNPEALVQHFPSLGPVLQMAQGQDLRGMYMSLCQKHGIDPNVILNELRS